MTDLVAATIRPRIDADLPTLGRILTEVHERDGYPVEGVADPIAWLHSDRMLGAWVAVIDGEPVGHVALTRPSDSDDAARLWTERTGARIDSIAILGRLFVHPTARGHHLGQRLTITATHAAHTLGRRAVLDVMAKDVSAIHTYETLGWQHLGDITHHYGGGQTQAAHAYASAAI